MQAEQRKKPLTKHLEEFEAYLEDKGNTNDHVDKTISRCKRIVEKAGAATVRDLTAEKVEEALAAF